MTASPTHLTIRTYNVGFGDCFLLTFHYAPKTERHILIDFGSQKAKTSPSGILKTVAASIHERTGGKLHAVVATHRHQDHIRGFGLKGAGDVIEGMKPDVVLQPWTEDPQIATDAKAPARKPKGKASAARPAAKAHVRQLGDMNAFAEAYFADVENGPLASLAGGAFRGADQLAFIGENNIKNRGAVEALIRMSDGGRGRYLSAGQNAGLSNVLPGVTVDVLGPPTEEQHPEVRKQVSRQEDQYWHLHAAAASAAVSRKDPFNAAGTAIEVADIPADARWFCRRLRKLRAESLLSIVRTLDDAMNNTSLILLFTVGEKAVLFPGDAQYENWQFAMGDDELMEKLTKVDVYKVGHHGSLNATPKSVWEKFDKRGGKAKAGKRLKTLLSTLSEVHGHEENDTEVPRRPLVNALREKSDVTDTETLDEGDFSEVVVRF